MKSVGRTGGLRRGWCIGNALGILIAAGVPLAIGCPQPVNLSEGIRATDWASHAVPMVVERRFGHGQVQLLQPLPFDCQPVAKADRATQEDYPVPRPPFSKGVFPCTRCHDNPEDHNATKRVLTAEHRSIQLVHGPREQWCYGCHNPTDRDTLRLAGGRTVEFSRSYELCGQCHGPKLKDWRLGIHGRRAGCWNGERQYLLCVNCHSPHAPRFRSLEPLPRPLRPPEIVLARGRGHRGGAR